MVLLFINLNFWDCGDSNNSGMIELNSLIVQKKIVGVGEQLDRMRVETMEGRVETGVSPNFVGTTGIEIIRSDQRPHRSLEPIDPVSKNNETDAHCVVMDVGSCAVVILERRGWEAIFRLRVDLQSGGYMLCEMCG
jgi:hypothetical protein